MRSQCKLHMHLNWQNITATSSFLMTQDEFDTGCGIRETWFQGGFWDPHTGPEPKESIPKSKYYNYHRYSDIFYGNDRVHRQIGDGQAEHRCYSIILRTHSTLPLGDLRPRIASGTYASRTPRTRCICIWTGNTTLFWYPWRRPSRCSTWHRKWI